MKTLITPKTRLAILFLISIVALILLTVFSCKKASEKAGEKIMETTLGDQANIELDDDSFVMETEEGSYSTDATVKSWPNEIPKEVPEFKHGELVNLSTLKTVEITSWTLLFDGVSNSAMTEYSTTLKRKGFEVQTLTINGDKAHLSAEKKPFIVVVMGGDGMASLNVGIEK